MREDNGRYEYNFYEPGTRGHSAKTVFGYEDDDEPEPDETSTHTNMKIHLRFDGLTRKIDETTSRLWRKF